jgi:hypothetical protein
MLPKISNPFEKLKIVFENLQKGISLVIEKTPDSLIELSRYGWYIDLEMESRVPLELSVRLKNGESDYVDNYLSEYYIQKINRIQTKLCENYPRREKILIESFDCFKRKKYYSMITLLLTQVDGFCYDKTKKLFFKNNNKLKRQKIYAPEVEKEIIRMSGDIIDILLEPMKNAAIINENTKNIIHYPIKLNRHAILHGMDTNYGTELNCLRIVSLLNYINDILEK